jgi:hypothetical protein
MIQTVHSFLRDGASISLCKLSVLAETLSKFGAGLFLLVQVIILLDCTHSWNDAWVEKDEQKWSVQVFRSYQTFFHCFLLASNLIFGMFLGILLYFRCQLYATLQHLRSQEFCSFGSILPAMTVASMSSSLS